MTTNSGRSPSGRASRPTDQAATRLGDTATIPNADEPEDDLQRGYAAWGRGETFDKFQSAGWADGWKTADDFAWWKAFAEKLGGSVHGFTHRNSATIVISGEYHSIGGSLVRALAIAMEAAKPSRRETGSTEGDSGDPKGIARKEAP